MKKLRSGQAALIFLFFTSALILGAYVLTRSAKRTVRVEGYSPFREVRVDSGHGVDIKNLSSPLRTPEYVNPPTHYYEVTVSD